MMGLVHVNRKEDCEISYLCSHGKGIKSHVRCKGRTCGCKCHEGKAL